MAAKLEIKSALFADPLAELNNEWNAHELKFYYKMIKCFQIQYSFMHKFYL